MIQSVPAASRLVLRNAAVPAALLDQPRSGALVRLDITLTEGRVDELAPAGQAIQPGIASHDCAGGLVLPCFVDLHTHLDKGQIWPRRQNPDGTWAGALAAVAEDRREYWAAGDVERDRKSTRLNSSHANISYAVF